VNSRYSINHPFLLAALTLFWLAGLPFDGRCCLADDTASDPATRLEIYQPEIRHVPIYFRHPGSKPYLKYNHDSDIVRFKGRFIAAWNANEVPREGVPGQYNFLTTSEDFERWSPPIRPFMSEAGAVNPIDDDSQWQPIFINYHDRTLFCAWCVRSGEKRTVISQSTDGVHWTNRIVQRAPAGMNDLAGFPTTHGIVTSKDVMLFPCSLPPIDRFAVNETRYGAILRSEDGGKTWHWSEPVEAVRWSDLREKPEDYGGDTIILWEPVVFEQSDGRIGLLVRNSTSQGNPEYPLKTHHTILYAYSEDEGKTWSKARPIEVDSTFSRMLAMSGVNNPHSLLMVMNDWVVGVPDPIPRDRLFQSLYLAPVPDPDLLLPGPIVQPAGGTAFYPNGFVADGKLYISYTYDGIFGSVVESLPDFSRPFLLPRGGRQGLRIEGRTAHFAKRESSLGLVLTSELTRQPTLHLSFRIAIDYFPGSDLPLLTIGGKTRQGVNIRGIYDQDRKANYLQFRRGSTIFDLDTFELGQWNAIDLQIDGNDVTVSANGKPPAEITTSVMRKICFGGLYVRPDWPLGLYRAHQGVRLDLDSIVIE